VTFDASGQVGHERLEAERELDGHPPQVAVVGRADPDVVVPGAVVVDRDDLGADVGTDGPGRGRDRGAQAGALGVRRAVGRAARVGSDRSRTPPRQAGTPSAVRERNGPDGRRWAAHRVGRSIPLWSAGERLRGAGS
jgi:hypothetical protein